MTVNTFDQQTLKAFNQALRTLGVPATYKNGAGTTKNIRAMFTNKEAEIEDEPTRLVGQKPMIEVLSSDIDDRNTDTATFTINSTTYYADQYVDDNVGIMEIFLRL